MALIQMPDGEARIFRAWIAYLGESTPQTRTEAFFAAPKSREAAAFLAGELLW